MSRSIKIVVAAITLVCIVLISDSVTIESTSAATSRSSAKPQSTNAKFNARAAARGARSSIKALVSSDAGTIVQPGTTDLMSIGEWKIRITSKETDFNSQDIFEVQRRNGSMSVYATQLNLKSGRQSPNYDDWQARWKTGYYTPDVAYLEVYRCWYKYKYIQEGFECEYHRVPAQFSSSDVIGDWDDDGVVENPTDPYHVEVLSKSTKPSPCNVKGSMAEDGTKVYYTKDSQYFDKMDYGFQCYETAAAASKAGYSASYR